MRPEDPLLRHVFEDLEQQAEGLQLAARDAELVDRRRSEYAEVTFLGRLHASVGQEVRLAVAGVGALDGRVARVGLDWCLVEAAAPAQEWVVLLAAVKLATGLSDRAVSEVARPVTARLGVRSVLRGVADSRAEVVVHHLDGSRSAGLLGRVGADFVELVGGPVTGRRRGPADVVRLETVAAVRRTS